MSLTNQIFVTFVCILVFLSTQAGAELKETNVLPPEDLPYSFVQTPHIHPKIVQDLTSWMSDRGDQVVAINLKDSQESNRYFGEVLVREVKGAHPYVYVQESDKAFGYQYVGKTKAGLHILYTSEWDGGSGVFKRLLLLAFEYDEGIQVDWDESVIRSGERRVLLRKLGQIALGDRWAGELRVDGNELFIGRDDGWFEQSGGKGGGWLSSDRKDRTLRIDVTP